MDKSGSAHLRIRADEFSRLLFEEASDGFFVSNPSGEYFAVNRSGHRMLGYPPGELVGKYMQQVILPHNHDRLDTALAQVALGATIQEIWPMIRKDGSIVQLEVSVQLISNGSVMAVVRDPRGRDEFERQIQTSEANLRSILRTAPDTIVTVDRAGKILFVNRTYPPFTVDDLVGASCFEFVPPESRPRVRAAIDHVFATREFDEYEVMAPPDEEGERWSSVRAGPVVQGDEVVAVTLCASNISRYKREQARTHELLDRVAKIARLVPGLVYQYQLWPDGRACFPYASERIQEIYGVSPEDVRETDDAIWAVIHPDDRECVRESLHASAAKLENWQHEFRVQLADREDQGHWLYGNAVPERQGDGSTLWHGFITDVTEHKHAERSARALQAQLIQAQKMESVGQLAGGVAHDFNNLLTTVVAFVELAQEELPPNARLREYLDGVLAATSRGAELTQQLLAFARKKLVQPEPTVLNAVLTRMAPLLTRLLGEHIEVELKLAAALGTVKVDVGSIEQVIMNLVVNARDAMPRGGRLTLETCERTDIAKSVVAINVTDTGTGMPPEIRARLFEPFFTTKAPGHGTGLGLAMCHGIIQQAGGQISVHSEFGSGTRFTIQLPRHSEPAAAQVPVRVEDPAVRVDGTGHETVLVVEDETMILRVAKTALESRGYRVLCATNGIEALDLARSTATHIDMLISDVVMPALGGPELAVRLRALRPGIKVLFTSGYAENQLGTHGVLREGVNFIQKPYTFAVLAQRVRELLDKTV